MRKRIFSIGFAFPGNEAELVPFRSEQSLQDADIVVFEPDVTSEYYVEGQFHGKPSISESDSFALVENITHWQGQLRTAFDEGKTIFIFLSRFQEVYVYTGTEQSSETGRNTRITKHVAPRNNYESIPLDLGNVILAKGSEIRVAKDLGPLSTYWKLCSGYSSYEVYLGDEVKEPLLVTKTGSKIVGVVIRGGKGAIFLLPPLRFPPDQFVERVEEDEDEEEEKEEKEYWTPEALRFGKQLASCLVEIDKVLRAAQSETPAPEWTKDTSYRFSKEAQLEREIRKSSKTIQELREKRTSLTLALEEAGSLRKLLYEKGKALERAILEALRLIGFEAKQFQEDGSDFDAVFAASEGRFLGEAEGTDNRAINIDKLSQLERNLQEDFAREEVTAFAKGVLFGNAYRLMPLDGRKGFFTAKCLSGAKRSKVALIRTPDLFEIAKYLKSNKDAAFARDCRAAILQAEGEVVRFPQAPGDEAKSVKEIKKAEASQKKTIES